RLLLSEPLGGGEVLPSGGRRRRERDERLALARPGADRRARGAHRHGLRVGARPRRHGARREPAGGGAHRSPLGEAPPGRAARPGRDLAAGRRGRHEVPLGGCALGFQGRGDPPRRAPRGGDAPPRLLAARRSAARARGELPRGPGQGAQVTARLAALSALLDDPILLKELRAAFRRKRFLWLQTGLVALVALIVIATMWYLTD